MHRATPWLVALAGAALAGATVAFGLGVVPWVAGWVLVLGGLGFGLAWRGDAAGTIGVVLVVVVCAGAIAAPGVLQSRADDAAVAWTVPADERLALADGEDAITVGLQDGLLRGRDAATGDRRWAQPRPATFSEPSQSTVVPYTSAYAAWVNGGGSDLVRLRGPGRPGPLGGSSIASGNGVVTVPVGSDETAVAVRCTTPADFCNLVARGNDDGEIRWTAPVAQRRSQLGAPRPLTTSWRLDDGLAGQLPAVWRTQSALLVAPDARRARIVDVDTGETLRRLTVSDTDRFAIAGSVLLRADAGGTLTGIPVRGGAGWSVDLRAEGLELDGLGGPELPLPGGWLVARGAGDGLAFVDARDGRVVRAPDVDGEVAGPAATEAPSPRLVVTGDGESVVVDTAEGQVLRRRPDVTPGSETPLVGPDWVARTVVADDLVGRDRRTVVVERLADGTAIGRWSQPNRRGPAPVRQVGDRLVVDGRLVLDTAARR